MAFRKRMLLMLLAALLLLTLFGCGTPQSKELPQDKYLALLYLPKQDVLTALGLAENKIGLISSGVYETPLTVKLQGITFSVSLAFNLHDTDHKLNAVYLTKTPSGDSLARELSQLGSFFTDSYGPAFTRWTEAVAEKDTFFFAGHTPEEIQKALIDNPRQTDRWDLTSAIPEKVMKTITACYALAERETTPHVYANLTGIVEGEGAVIQIVFYTEGVSFYVKDGVRYEYESPIYD